MSARPGSASPSWPHLHIGRDRRAALNQGPARHHAEEMETGAVVVQGEDLRRCVQGCRLGWDALQPAQQWLLGNAFGLGPDKLRAERRGALDALGMEWAVDAARRSRWALAAGCCGWLRSPGRRRCPFWVALLTATGLELPLDCGHLETGA